MIIFHVKLDDPLDSVAVHGTGGVLGLLAVPFFMYATLDVRHIYIWDDIQVNLNWLCPKSQYIWNSTSTWKSFAIADKRSGRKNVHIHYYW